MFLGESRAIQDSPEPTSSIKYLSSISLYFALKMISFQGMSRKKHLKLGVLEQYLCTGGQTLKAI